MPNNYWNEIYIYGDKKVINKIKEKLVNKNEEGNEYVDFNLLLPMPEILHRVIVPVTNPIQVYDLDENGEFDPLKSKRRPATKEEMKEIETCPFNNWYDWASNIWGTKWNAYDSVVEYEEYNKETGYFTIGFSTAWCPPQGWLSEVEELCEELEAEYCYRGWDESELPLLRKNDNPMCEKSLEQSLQDNRKIHESYNELLKALENVIEGYPNREIDIYYLKNVIAKAKGKQ